MRNLSEGKGSPKDIGEAINKTYSKEEINQITEIGIQALRAAKTLHDRLGEDGLTPVGSPNKFNEQALKADVKVEEAVLKLLRKFGLPIRIFSEEHGIIDHVKKPKLLGVLDGIDGTSQYRAGRDSLRYATILGISNGVNPRYRDYIFSGIMEHATNRLWVGIRGKGSFLVDPDGNRTQIHASSQTIFDDSTRIYSMEPDYNETARNHLTNLVKKFHTKLPLSEAIALADISSGEADVLVEVTRKGNLEQMAAFGLIIEGGGVMVDINGRSIANQRYLEWGQKESLLLVTTSTPELARNFLEKLNGL